MSKTFRLNSRCGTVGVAPGTTTLQIPSDVAAAGTRGLRDAWIDPPPYPYPCPPDPVDYLAYDKLYEHGWNRNWREFHLGGLNGLGWYNPYSDVIQLSDDVENKSPHIRWDLIGLVGGGALVIALTTGLLASAFSGRK